MKTYSEEEATAKLTTLSGWVFKDSAIEKTYVFKDFREAVSFMVRISFICEEMNHHPDWTNIYNRIFIRLSTHDAGGVTDKDFALADKIEKIIS